MPELLYEDPGPEKLEGTSQFQDLTIRRYNQKTWQTLRKEDGTLFRQLVASVASRTYDKQGRFVGNGNPFLKTGDFSQ